MDTSDIQFKKFETSQIGFKIFETGCHQFQ